jgi:hypothetical protein
MSRQSITSDVGGNISFCYCCCRCCCCCRRCYCLVLCLGIRQEDVWAMEVHRYGLLTSAPDGVYRSLYPRQKELTTQVFQSPSSAVSNGPNRKGAVCSFSFRIVMFLQHIKTPVFLNNLEALLPKYRPFPDRLWNLLNVSNMPSTDGESGIIITHSFTYFCRQRGSTA